MRGQGHFLMCHPHLAAASQLWGRALQPGSLGSWRAAPQLALLPWLLFGPQWKGVCCCSTRRLASTGAWGRGP